jgi:ABC-type branched-subunit amino acid transport system substrate-binding protein
MIKLSRRTVLAATAALAATRARAEDAPIKIGFVGPLSGSLSLLGNSVRDGLSIYVTAINEKGGVAGRKLELIAEDDGYDPARTVAAGKKLKEQDGVVAIVAPAGTAGTAALLPFVQDSKTPLLFPYAFSHALTNPTKRYAFTTLPEVRVQMNVMGDYLLNTLKQTKIAAIYQNDDFGQDAVTGLDATMTAHKLDLLKLPFDRGTTNFSGVVTQAKAGGAEVVVFLGIPRDAALVMREANKLGWKPQFAGHNALSDPQTFELAGNLAEGALAVAVMEPLDSDKPAVKEFLATQARIMPKAAPTTYSMHGYNAGLLFAEAVRRANGDTSADALVTALQGISNFDTGLMGPITFTADQHAGSLSCAMIKGENKKWHLITGWMQASST